MWPFLRSIPLILSALSILVVASLPKAEETTAEPVTATVAPPAAAVTAPAPATKPVRLRQVVRERERSQTSSETLFAGEITHGGYGGPAFKYSSVAGQGAWFLGARGGWLINRRVTLGGGVFGMTSRIPAANPDRIAGEDILDILQFSYGGVILELHGRPTKLVNGTMTLFVGGGGVTIFDEQANRPMHGYYGTPVRNDAVFVFEPEGMVNLNIASFFRLGVGGGYRWVRGLHLDGVENRDFTTPTATVMFKFGKFD